MHTTAYQIYPNKMISSSRHQPSAGHRRKQETIRSRHTKARLVHKITPRKRQKAVRICSVILLIFVIITLAGSSRPLHADRTPNRIFSVAKRAGNPAFQAGSYGEPSFVRDLQQDKIQAYGNEKDFIAIHYLGVAADGHAINENGNGAHFYIYSDGTIYQSASLDSVPWQVGTAGCYEQLHPVANNYNTIGIELCPKCDGDETNDKDPTWYFTEETQESCALLVRALMRDLGIKENAVLRHGDIVNKWCPAPYFNNNHYKTSWTWEEFRKNTFSLTDTEIPDFPIEF